MADGDANHPKTTAQNPNFVADYFGSSRLHFIGSFRARYESMLAAVAKRLRKNASELLQPVVEPAKGSRERVIVHVDMDAFFASIAVRDNPRLRGRPIAVCHAANDERAAVGVGHGGEISSCSYEARACGVRAGMFLNHARKECPDLVAVPYDFAAYERASIVIYTLFYQLDNVVVQAQSVDEAYLDVTNCLAVAGDWSPSHVDDLVQRLRNDIYHQTGCRASAGIGPSKLVARVATSRAKPNGQLRVRPEDVADFILSLDVNDLPRIGRRTSAKLSELGVQTCADLQKVSLTSLQSMFGEQSGQTYYNVCRGLDIAPVEPLKPRKSIGAEVSWAVRFDVNDSKKVTHFVTAMAHEVASRCKAAGAVGRKATYKAYRKKTNTDRFHKFLGHGPCDIFTKSCKLDMCTDQAFPDVLSRACLDLHSSLRIQSELLRGVAIQVGDLVFGAFEEKEEADEEGLARCKSANHVQSILGYLRKDSRREGNVESCCAHGAGTDEAAQNCVYKDGRRTDAHSERPGSSSARLFSNATLDGHGSSKLDYCGRIVVAGNSDSLPTKVESHQKRILSPSASHGKACSAVACEDSGDSAGCEDAELFLSPGPSDRNMQAFLTEDSLRLNFENTTKKPVDLNVNRDVSIQSSSREFAGKSLPLKKAKLDEVTPEATECNASAQNIREKTSNHLPRSDAVDFVDETHVIFDDGEISEASGQNPGARVYSRCKFGPDAVEPQTTAILEASPSHAFSGEEEAGDSAHAHSYYEIPPEWDKQVFMSLPSHIQKELVQGGQMEEPDGGRTRRNSRHSAAAGCRRREETTDQAVKPRSFSRVRKRAQVTMTQLAVVSKVKADGSSIVSAEEFKQRRMRECVELLEDLHGQDNPNGRACRRGRPKSLTKLVDPPPGTSETLAEDAKSQSELRDHEDCLDIPSPPMLGIETPVLGLNASNADCEYDSGVLTQLEVEQAMSGSRVFNKDVLPSIAEKLFRWMRMTRSDVRSAHVELLRARLLEQARNRELARLYSELVTIRRFSVTVGGDWLDGFNAILRDVQYEVTQILSVPLQIAPITDTERECSSIH